MVVVVLLVMMQIIVIGCQRVPTLYWTHFLICIMTPMFSSVRASDTLLIHLTLSTDYLSTVLLANKFLANIPKKGISKLDASFTGQYYFST